MALGWILWSKQKLLNRVFQSVRYKKRLDHCVLRDNRRVRLSLNYTIQLAQLHIVNLKQLLELRRAALLQLPIEIGIIHYCVAITIHR
jgi:hypothetical protein